MVGLFINPLKLSLRQLFEQPTVSELARLTMPVGWDALEMVEVEEGLL